MGAYLTWKPKSGSQKSLYFDVVTSETQTLSTTITEHPVEEGPDVADHMRRDLDAVTLEVFVSNTPVFDVNNRGGKVVPVELKVEKYEAPLELTPGSVFSAAGGALKKGIAAIGDALGLGNGEAKNVATVMKFATEFDAISDTLILLRGLRNTSQLVDVMLPSRIYQGMALTNLEVRRDVTSGEGATFVLEFRELRKVATLTTKVPLPAEPRAKPKKNRGVQEPQRFEPTPKKKSMLKSFLG
ncbi:MAG: hypothetical protein U0183_10690 [Polyangiaceae bacterium]